MSFKTRVRKRSILIAAIPLVLTFAFFMNLRVEDINSQIKKDLKEIAYVVSSTPLVEKNYMKKKMIFQLKSMCKTM